MHLTHIFTRLWTPGMGKRRRREKSLLKRALGISEQWGQCYIHFSGDSNIYFHICFSRSDTVVSQIIYQAKRRRCFSQKINSPSQNRIAPPLPGMSVPFTHRQTVVASHLPYFWRKNICPLWSCMSHLHISCFRPLSLLPSSSFFLPSEAKAD